MSYIRSGSNPEGLYIFGDDKHANLTTPNSAPDYPLVDLQTWNRFLIRSYLSGFNDCSYRNLKLTEVEVNVQIHVAGREHWRTGDQKLELKVGDKVFAVMWDVTWQSIVYGYLDSLYRKKNIERRERIEHRRKEYFFAINIAKTLKASYGIDATLGRDWETGTPQVKFHDSIPDGSPAYAYIADVHTEMDRLNYDIPIFKSSSRGKECT